MIMPHEFRRGLVTSPDGVHCRDCGYVQADSIHDTSAALRPLLPVGITITAEAEVIPGNLADGSS